MAKIAFTGNRVKSFSCPADTKQAFLWDATAPGLGLRATPAGKLAFVFQGEFHQKSIRITIGSPDAWNIPQAQEKARELQRLIDEGKDPRGLKRDALAAYAAKHAEAVADAVTVGEAWELYLVDRREAWGELHYRDHIKMAQIGGQLRTRRPGVKTLPGPIAELLSLRLADLTAPVIEAWAAKEAKARPARLRLALRLLKAFMRWAAAESGLKGKADPTAASAKKAREVAGKPELKNDYLQREQLKEWFTHVRQIPNPVIATYLQCLLLTGPRREELAELKWQDIDFKWNGIKLKDKVVGRRDVPLTPFVAHLMASLPRRNEWVFSSLTSASGRLTEPSIAHRRACIAAGLNDLTLQGLRRSFASLCEWLDIPGGVSAQIQGHAPQGVREQNYVRRPLDLLRVHHEKIETWILEQAGVVFDAGVCQAESLKHRLAKENLVNAVTKQITDLTDDQI